MRPLLFVLFLVVLCGCSRGQREKQAANNQQAAIQPVAPQEEVKAALPPIRGEDVVPRVLASADWLNVEADRFRIGPVMVEDFGKVQPSRDNFLSFRVRVSVTDRRRKFDYSSWCNTDHRLTQVVFDQPYPVVKDDLGNTYEAVSFKGLAKIVGRVSAASLDAESTVTDFLVFDKPVPAANWVELVVPVKLAENDAKTLRLRIYGSQIVAGGEDAFAAFHQRLIQKAEQRRDAEAKRLAAPFQEGELCFVTHPEKQAPAGSTVEALREFLDAIAVKDEGKIARLTDAGRVTRIDTGTRGSVVGVEGDAVKVLFDNGPHAGATLFLLRKHLTRK